MFKYNKEIHPSSGYLFFLYDKLQIIQTTTYNDSLFLFFINSLLKTNGSNK